jgi:hypothetical protein
VASNYFRSQTVLNAGAGQGLPGISEGIQRFFNRRGLANSAITLTWDPKKSRRDDRRSIACGSSYCDTTQTTLRGTAPGIQVSCDEFPFAGSEEGGGFLQTLATDPTNTEATCIPAWQNTAQGNCNSKWVLLLGCWSSAHASIQRFSANSELTLLTTSGIRGCRQIRLPSGSGGAQRLVVKTSRTSS